MLHNFCSRACAKASASTINCEVSLLASAAGHSQVILTDPFFFDPFRQHCKVRPKYNDGKSTHPFCSRTCASASKTNGTQNGNGNGNGNSNGNHSNGNGHTPQRGNTMPGALTVTPPVNTCSTPGCQAAVYKDSNGASGKYCSKSHKAYVRTFTFIDRRTTLTRRSTGWVTRAALRAGRLKSPARPTSARPAKFPSCRTLLLSSKLRQRTRHSRVVCFSLATLLPLACVRLRSEDSRPTVQAFVETHHSVPQGSGHLQDRFESKEPGRVPRVPVCRYPSLYISTNPHTYQMPGIPWRLVATSRR